jgi:tRNA pseudouridine55 synthase
VVDVARRSLRTRRVGHAGTLDPFATGLLVLLVGHTTRLLPYLNGEPKVYEATIAFGSETDTDDATGSMTRAAEPPEVSRVREAIRSLTGEIDQVPPAYSAKQVEGRRAYAAARRGESLTLAPVRVVVHRWEVRDVTGERLDAAITCGGGTYIRALARDLGRLSGSAAHLSNLRRTRSGSFDVLNAVAIDELRAGGVAPLPARAAVSHLPALVLRPDQVAHVRQGRVVAADDRLAGDDTTAALVDSAGSLVALAERADASWQPRVVLPNA